MRKKKIRLHEDLFAILCLRHIMADVLKNEAQKFPATFCIVGDQGTCRHELFGTICSIRQ